MSRNCVNESYTFSLVFSLVLFSTVPICNCYHAWHVHHGHDRIPRATYRYFIHKHRLYERIRTLLFCPCSPKRMSQATRKQVPVGTTMRPGSRLMLAEEEEETECFGGGSYWWSPWGLGMCYLLISSRIHWWKSGYRLTDQRTNGPTDRPSYRDAWTHLKTIKKQMKTTKNNKQQTT